MKVLTLNTHSWMEPMPQQKLRQLAAAISMADYDVIALQEVNQTKGRSVIQPSAYFHPAKVQEPIREDNFAYQLVEQLAGLGTHYHWTWRCAHIGYDIYEEGVAILSKQPITAEAFFASAGTDPSDYRTRVIVAGQTKLADRLVTVLSGHYSWWSHEPGTGFAYEWQQTEAFLEDVDTPLLIMGDFNNPAHIADEGYALVQSSPLQLQDAFAAAAETIGEFTVEKTIDGWSESTDKLRIDLIFLSQEFAVKSYQVMFDGQATPVVSDHYGVAAELAWQ